MFSLFSGQRRRAAHARDRASQLASTLERRRRGARVRAARLSRRRRAAGGDPRRSARGSRSWRRPRPPRRPGQRYLLERKLDGEKTVEMRAVTQRIVDEIVDALARARARSRCAIADSAAADADARREARWCSTRRFSSRRRRSTHFKKRSRRSSNVTAAHGLPVRLHRALAAISLRRTRRPMA